MARLFTRIIRKIIPEREKRCPRCKRFLPQAISEQLAEGRGCTIDGCAFEAEIRQALLELKTPELTKWEINKKQIFENENITLSWEVLYTKRVTISGLGDVQLKDSRTISLRKNTSYTLILQDYKGNYYKAEQQLNVTVFPLPIIEIREESLKIERGRTAILRWNANYINKIILAFNNQIIDVSDFTEFSVQPKEQTTYKLIFTALDNKKTIEKEIRVEVFPRPEIKHFEVSPEVAIASIPVTISWRVENAKRVEINNGIGEVNKEGSITILHDKNTLYQITALGELSYVTKDIVVKVFPTPIIESILVPMPDFESRVVINPILVNPPKIDFTIQMPEFNFTPTQAIEPDIDLLTIKPLYKNKLLIFNFLKLYELFKHRAKF